MAQDNRLSGRVALVTGGGKGIGAVYCRGLAREGAAIAAADVDQEAAESLARDLREEGVQAIGLRIDVADPSSVESAIAQTVSQLGSLDILVNNAALYTALLPKRPFWELTAEDWDRVMRVNVTGLFLCAKAALPHLKTSGHGRIINIASGVVFVGTPGFLHYVASKSAVIGFTRSLAREVGEFNITVNSVAPGLTASETAKQIQTEQELAATNTFRALKRTQVPEDLVGAVCFLASDDSAFMTGQTLLVDGGVAFN